jgi:hypothetical protein
MAGYRCSRDRGVKDKRNKTCIVSAHNVIDWCSMNPVAKRKYLKSPCKDSYLIIRDDNDKHLSCSCGCHYSKKIKEFCSNKERMFGMVSMMMISNGKQLKRLNERV